MQGTVAGAEKIWLDDIGIVDDEEAAVRVAKVLLDQTERVLTSTEGWTDVSGKDSTVKLQKKSYSNKDLLVVRSEGVIECGAEDLYNLLITKRGYRLLDPISDPDDFNQPILGPFKLESEGALGDERSQGDQASRTVQVEYEVMKSPIGGNREFVMANVKDGTKLVFLSSSVCSSIHPGGSSHQDLMPVTSSWSAVRVAASVAYTCHRIQGDESACIFKVWQAVDFGGWVPQSASNLLNVQYFGPAYQRIREYEKGHKRARNDEAYRDSEGDGEVLEVSSTSDRAWNPLPGGRYPGRLLGHEERSRVLRYRGSRSVEPLISRPADEVGDRSRG